MEKSSSETCDCIDVSVIIILFASIAVALLTPFAIFAMEAKDCPNDGNSISASASLSNIEHSFSNITTSSTFTFNLRIKLVPFVDTKYGNTTVFLISHDNGTTSIIDESPVPGAHVREGETRRLDVSVRMVSRYRFDNDSVLVYSDPVASSEGGGVVRVRAHVRFSGEEVGGFVLFKERPVAEVDCELAVDLKSRTLRYNECQPKVSCKAKA